MQQEQDDSPEEKRRKYDWSIAFGTWAMAKKRKGAEVIDISRETTDIMYFFFNAGWDWGKDERPAKCPDCCYDLTQERDHE